MGKTGTLYSEILPSMNYNKKSSIIVFNMLKKWHTEIGILRLFMAYSYGEKFYLVNVMYHFSEIAFKNNIDAAILR